MHNYWIGIMALAFVLAMATWLLLVFNADRRQGPGKTQDSSPHREVIGGEFEAREGGRQLMPHPAQPSEPPHVPAQPGAGSELPRQRMPAAAERSSAEVPAQETAEPPPRAPARVDRP